MTEPALSAHNFGRQYRRRATWAVRDLTLEIPHGSITALVGPNGAGKSTLIRSWMGFERPDEGRVLVQGLDVARERTEAVARLGYVPQSSALYRDLSVADHFALARTYRPQFDPGAAAQRVADAGIGLSRRVGELSGGEQAQVALAVALSTQAPILLLDEPLASLDPLARREFLTVLVEHVRSSGRTATLSSHIVTDVQQACDRLVVLARGSLLLHASVADARREHRVVSADVGTEGAIGVFSGPDGERIALVRDPHSTLPEATLEEIVLGYMSSQRSGRAN